MPEASQVYSKDVKDMWCDPEGVVDSMKRTFCYKPMTPKESFLNTFSFFYKAMTPMESFTYIIPIFYKAIIPLGLGKMPEASKVYNNETKMMNDTMPEASQVYRKYAMNMMCDPEGVVDSMMHTFCYKPLIPMGSFLYDIPFFYKPIIPKGLK